MLIICSPETLYRGYKDLQRRLEEQRYSEQPSVGGTGRVKAMPVSTAEILACKQLKVLQSLQQYYRERHSLLKRIIDTRKLVMKRFFHVHDKDWGMCLAFILIIYIHPQNIDSFAYCYIV